MDTVDTAVTAATRPKLAEAEIRRLTAAADRTMLLDIAGPEAEKRWAEAPITRRRAILEALGLRVVILPDRPARPRLRPGVGRDRVEGSAVSDYDRGDGERIIAQFHSYDCNCLLATVVATPAGEVLLKDLRPHGFPVACNHNGRIYMYPFNVMEEKFDRGRRCVRVAPLPLSRG